MRAFNSSSKARSNRQFLGLQELESRRLLAFDPSGMEQAYFESINRMRLDPQAELSVMLSSVNPLVARDNDVQEAIDFFDVSGFLLQTQWNELTPVPPVAWNEDLSESAAFHNQQMVEHDLQRHQLPDEPPLGERATTAGYSWRRLLENIYAYSESVMHGHAGFVIDWGEGPGGIQDPPGHRENYMDDRVTDVGIDVLRETNSFTEVGPYLVTHDFGQPSSFSPLLLGVVWNDGNANGIYDDGEGLGNVNVRITGTGGTFTTSSMSAGGYQLEVPAGTYEVIASGGGLGAAVGVGSVVVSDQHMKVDFEKGSGILVPSAAADSSNVDEDSVVSIAVLANDQAPGSFPVPNTVSIVADPAHGTAEARPSGTVFYRPNPDFFGTDTFRYTFKNAAGITSSTGVVTVSVANTPDPPVAQNATVATAEDIPRSIDAESLITVADSPINWQAVSVIGTPAGGQVSFDAAQRTFLFTPSPNYFGSAEFTYQAVDTVGRASQPANVLINVTAVNDAATAVGDVFSVVANGVHQLPVLTNDSDVDDSLADVELSFTSAAKHGSAQASPNGVQYVPNSGFQGVDSFRYRLRDMEGATSASVEVLVYVTDPSTPGTNPLNRFDVNADGIISPVDALNVINRIGNTFTASPPFADVTGDGLIGPLDALQVVNRLPSTSSILAPPSGATASSLATDATAANLPQAALSDRLDQQQVPAERLVELRASTEFRSGGLRRWQETELSDSRHVDAVFAENDSLIVAIQGIV